MKIFFAAFIIFGMAALQGDVVIRTELDGIEMAAKERANLFQMMGYYVQLGSNLHYHYPDENLKKNILEYETVLDDMEHQFSEEDIQRHLAHSKELWPDLKSRFVSILSNGADKNPDKKILETMLSSITLLAKDMEKIEALLIKKSLNPNLATEISATSTVMESSARLATYYILKVSVDPAMVQEDELNRCMKQYKNALNTIMQSELGKAKIFKKRFGKIKKVYFFNTMMGVSKTPIPSLVIKKNHTAYLSALVATRLITAASIEGRQKTMQMF